MNNENVEKMPGHWVLAKLGKKILRPGGLKLTKEMIDGLNINSSDDVVEFAPGLGLTAKMTCSHHPHSYTGVDINETVTKNLKQNLDFENVKIITGSASETGLPNASANKVYGEAMLTMHSNEQKKDIMSEAYRILKPNGLYGIHEICLSSNIADETRKKLYGELSNTIKVNVKPLTKEEWCQLLEESGFKVKFIDTTSMDFLSLPRILKDEGFGGLLRIMTRALTHKDLRRKALKMRSLFRKYQDDMQAICIISEK